MKKFVSGVIAGAVVGSATSVVAQNMTNIKRKEHKTIGKTLHSLGDMADNFRK